MEGVPRLYMIGLPAKYCDNDRKPDFISTINYHIRKSYDRDPSLYSTDIDTLQELRLSAMEAVKSPVCSVNECTILKRYYANLVRLVEKFPRLLQQQDSYSDEAKMARPTPLLTFTWKRALGGKMNNQRQKRNKDTDLLANDIGNIGYEMRCVLYNIGAAHSRLAAAQDRSPPLVSPSTSTTAETESSSNTALKIACTHLQCAAWAFQQLLGGSGETNSEHSKWHHRQKPFVTTRAVLEFAYNVTLAQAQECILEKSMMDGRKPLIIAKVSAMICEYFAGAIDAVRRVECEPSCVSVKRLEKWRLYSEFKCRYYGAITALFQGQHVQDQLQQMGTRVSYYRRAVNLLGRASQISESGIKTTSTTKDYDSADDEYYYYFDLKDRSPDRGLSAATKEFEMRSDTLSFAMDVAAAKWRAAKSENELIYHEHVVPVLSDDDDNDCLGNNSSLKTDGQQLDRVKGASLVKPIGFGVDDPELLAITITTHNKGINTITTTLFKDLVPAATRHRATIYRTEKCNMETEVRSKCQIADDQLTKFMDTLHLECLEMYKDNSSGFSYDEGKSNVADLPQQLVNCCATYQAMVQKNEQETKGTIFTTEELDQLDIDMARLSSAVQAVDSMLDEIDQLLKTEEQGNSEYQRTVGQPFDYSTVRMRELRREASRYRDAHTGRARDSWITLSQAVRNRRCRDLELLALPPDELAARLPPIRPMKNSIAAEVAAIGAMDSSSTFEIASDSEESPDKNIDSKIDENNGGRLRQLQRESIERLDRLNIVVEKMREVKEQRQTLLIRLRDEMDKEDRNALLTGQDDTDVLGEIQGSEEDITEAVKKKLNDLYGNLVNLIERNLTAQVKVLDAVRTAYTQTASERRAYTNAIQRRQNLVSSLLEAYENYMVANGETSLTTSNESITTSSISGILPDAILVERCAKGLDFYQRMLTNVSKLLQRVKGACQVQNEQRDQIIKLHHQQWDTALDNNRATSVNLSYQDHHLKDDTTLLIENFDGSNKHPTPLTSNWEQHDSRRLSPLGSEEQQHIYQYKFHDNEIIPTKSINKMTIGNDYYGYYSDNSQPDSDMDLHILNTAQQQQEPTEIPSILPPKVTYPATVNSTLMSPLMPSSSSNLYNYYNSKLLTTHPFSINPVVSSPSRPNQISSEVTNAFTTTAMNSLKNNNGTNKNKVLSSYSPNNCSSSRNSMNGDDDTTGGFTNAKAAVAALQRPLPSPYISGSVAIGRGFGNINNTGIGYGTVTSSGTYRPDLPIIQSQRSQQIQPQRQLQQQPEQQLQQQQQQPQQQKQQHQFNAQQFQQPRLAVSVGSTTGLETTGVFLQQQHQLISRDLTSSVQLPLSSTSISTTAMNNRCNVTATIQSLSSQGISTGDEFFPRLTSLQQPQQPFTLYQQQQQQPTQLYQQQPQIFLQQPQLLQQQSQLFQHQQHSKQQLQSQSQQSVQIYQPEIYQQQEMAHKLVTNGGNTASNFYYQSQQQQTSQMYHPQHQHQHQQQLQPTVTLKNVGVTGNNPLQSMSLPNINTGNSNYYQQLQQCYPPTTVTTRTAAVSLNTTATTFNSYYYQQPPVDNITYSNQQQQQFSNIYSGSTNIPSNSGSTSTVNLLDDDLLLSGPPPIQPEKIGNFDVTTTSS